MTIALKLDPEIESRLLAQADAQGKSVEDLLGGIIEGFLKFSTAPDVSTQDPHRKTEQFLYWAKSHSVNQIAALSDRDISRESIYSREDRML